MSRNGKYRLPILTAAGVASLLALQKPYNYGSEYLYTFTLPATYLGCIDFPLPQHGDSYELQSWKFEQDVQLDFHGITGTFHIHNIEFPSSPICKWNLNNGGDPFVVEAIFLRKKVRE